MENQKKVSFRFDIDTHKCIRDGVPKLLEISEKTNAKFTFFLNAGKAVSFLDSVLDVLGYFSRQQTPYLYAENKSAFEKLGTSDYFIAALLNPSLSRYTENIKRIVVSGNELALHGGRNHAIWLKYAARWPVERIVNEMLYGLKKIHSIIPEYKVSGFASPGWATSEAINNAARRCGFSYVADIHTDKPNQCISNSEGLRLIPTNILAEPGGVAYFEHCAAKGYSKEQTITDFFQKLDARHDMAVVYDHPYWAGIKECKVLEEIIVRLQDGGYRITQMRDL